MAIPPGLLDATGTGWVPRPTSWSWRSATGLGSLRMIKLKILGTGSGNIAFKVVAKNASVGDWRAIYRSRPPSCSIPHRPSSGRCGDARFPGPPGPACTIDGTANKVRCR